MVTLGGLVVIVVAIWLIQRQVDVRLVLIAAALLIGLLAGHLSVVVQTFLQTFAREQFVLPICTAMGFAWVLRYTGCDRHLVHLLIRPVQRFRALLIPGAVVVTYLINVPIISQASTVMAVGPVLLPLLQVARVSPVTAGAALMLGASVGAEILNPGAPEVQTVSEALQANPRYCVGRNLPFSLLQMAVATVLFWWLSVRAERREDKKAAPIANGSPEPANAAEGIQTTSALRGLTPPARENPDAPSGGRQSPGPREGEPPNFQVNLIRALVPVVPVVLLFLAGPPLNVIHVPPAWLVGPGDAPGVRAESRLIGAAMLIGVVLAGLASHGKAGGIARAFFDGAGYAYAHIISVIVAAQCFGKAVESIGLAALLAGAIQRWPALLVPIAAATSLVFALVCGSGFAATQSLFRFFVGPARALGVDPVGVGSVVSLSTAAGRTMSPVAAVVLLSAELTGTKPLDLTRRVVFPLLVAVTAMVVLRLLLPAL
jgi:DcuC family C4-dicarboxylate transporter